MNPQITDVLNLFFRWAHVVAGIAWIGHLYFFNWVNGPFQGKIDGPTKKLVNPELMPRALFWFRWERRGHGSQAFCSRASFTTRRGRSSSTIYTPTTIHGSGWRSRSLRGRSDSSFTTPS